MFRMTMDLDPTKWLVGFHADFGTLYLKDEKTRRVEKCYATTWLYAHLLFLTIGIGLIRELREDA